MKRFACAFVAMALTCSAQTGPKGTAPGAKMSAELNRVDPGASVDVIVTYRMRPTDEHFDRAHALGGVDKKRYGRIQSAAFTMPASALKTLASDPDVRFVAPDRKVKAHLNLTAQTIHADTVWNLGYTGTGIGVALIDSGVAQDDPDLNAAPGTPPPPALLGIPLPIGNLPLGPASRIVYAEDFTQSTNNGNRYHTSDDYGHGTHVAGIIAGNGAASTGPNFIKTYKGIAPNANIISLRVLDQNGEGSDSLVIEAIDRAIQLQKQYNIRVMNLSLGRPVVESFANDPLCQAVEQAWQAGIVVVVAAGNEGRDNTFGEQGYGTIDAPGNDPLVLTVGAMKSSLTPTRVDDQITTYSSKGPTAVDHIVKPDIVAPGNLVAAALKHGTLVQEYPANAVNVLTYKSNGNPNDPSDYFILNGTSMAAGVVSGAVADLLAAHPALTPDQVKALLMLTSTKSFLQYSNDYLNLAGNLPSLQLSLAMAPSQLPPAQQAVQQAQNQLRNDQQKLAQDTQKQQADAGPLSADQTALTNAQNAVPAAQANSTSAAQAYANAQAAQAAAQTALNNAQAALQTAQRNYPGNSSQVKTAQANQQAAQTALQNAQQATNQAQQAANQAAQALQQAQQAVQQAQNHLNNDQQRYQQDSSQVAQDNANVTADTAALQAATNQLNQLNSLAPTIAANQQTIAAELNDPSQYSPLQYDIFTVGAGYLDLNAAVTSTVTPPAGIGMALSPVAWVDAATGEIDVTGDYADACASSNSGGSTDGPLAGDALCSAPLIGTASSLWGTNSMWAASAVWGDNSVWRTNSMWAANSMWAQNSMWAGAKNSMWAANSMWAKNSMWAAGTNEAFNSVWGANSMWAASTDGASGTDAASAIILGSGDPEGRN